MATAAKALYRGVAALTSTTLYILLDDIPLATTTAVPANDSAILEIKQTLATTKTIKALASAITVAFHISGIEIT